MKKLPKLERYNQIVWAVVGTGALLAVTVAVLAVAAMALYSLLKPDRGAVPVELVEGNAPDAPQTARYDFCQPVDVYGSPYQLIRVVSDRFVVRNKPATLRSRKYDSYSSEGPYSPVCGIYGSARPAAIINVLVRHADSGAMHLLLKENAVIQTLDYPEPPARKTSPDMSFPPRGALYWEISFEDSNGDNVIDERDDLGAYLSDPDGSHLARLSPAPSRVLEKTYDGKRQRLLLRIVRDTNNDKTLDDQDTPSLIEVNVAQRKIEREVLDSARLAEFMHQAEPKRQPPSAP
jgi:hypothetical protein